MWHTHSRKRMSNFHTHFVALCVCVCAPLSFPLHVCLPLASQLPWNRYIEKHTNQLTSVKNANIYRRALRGVHVHARYVCVCVCVLMLCVRAYNVFAHNCMPSARKACKNNRDAARYVRTRAKSVCDHAGARINARARAGRTKQQRAPQSDLPARMYLVVCTRCIDVYVVALVHCNA